MLVIIASSLVILASNSLANEVNSEHNWWRNSIIYQIYPRSFKDSNGDGVGDLPGIISKLEHIRDIGANALWLSPIYPSPQVDSGYDISNYTGIEELYGTLTDFDSLVAKSKELGLKVLLDFVPNHTSNKHPWFLKSVDRIKPYDDYYVWQDAKKGPNGERQPPNNWMSVFGGSAWEWNEKRQQYYYHAFAIAQPDLNFRNPLVIQEMEKILTFWMERGVDGFRIDVPYQMFEDEDLRDEPVFPQFEGKLEHIYTTDLNESYEVMGSWRKLVDKFVEEHHTGSKLLLIESHSALPNVMRYFEVGGTPFNFAFVERFSRNFTAVEYMRNIYEWLDALPVVEASNTPWVIGNHDVRRVASRYGKDGNWGDRITMLAMILPGIAVVYNGDEIGMLDTSLTYEQTLDPQGRIAGREEYVTKSRDPARTPFQWDNSTSSGFSSNPKTWLPVNDNYKTLNLASQEQAQISHYKVFKALSSLKKDPVLQEGSVEVLLVTDNILAVIRRLENLRTVVLLINFIDEAVDLDAKLALNIPEVLQVYTASVESGMDIGAAVNTTRLTLPGEASVVLIQ